MIQVSNWSNKQYEISGDVSIYQENGKSYVEFKDNFNTLNGPDLKLYITPTDIDTVANRDNVSDFQGIFIDDIVHKGHQKYELPNVNIDDMKSLIIHCTAFSVVWGGINIS